MWKAFFIFTFLCSCLVGSDTSADDDQDDGGLPADTGEASADLSVPGAWAPAPDVIAAGQQQYVVYEGPPAWNGGRNCGGGLLPGTRQLGDFIRANFAGQVSSYGGYACRQNTANAAETSVHGTGRALDLFIPMDRGDADNGKGDVVAAWMIRHAQAIGIQYMIWDHTQWSAAHTGTKLARYTGPVPHIDHIHVEINHAGAARQTPWFANPTLGDSGGGFALERAGDFDGDGKADLATFVRGDANTANQGHVYIARSTGAGFTGGELWTSFFSIGGEVPGVGDFDGDGKSDLVTFVRGDAATPNQGHVYVARSTGTAFGGGEQWASFFSIGGEIPVVGDFDGDGKSDVATFVRGDATTPNQGHVYVARSTGSSFSGAETWASFFAIGGEVPGAGDFNGDGKDDIITFVRGNLATANRGHVYVALSNGSSFGPAQEWATFFAIDDEVPVVADFDGDGKADIATFVRGTAATANQGHVYVALSTGTNFGGASTWHPFFSIGNEVPGAGDFDGDGKADVVTFTRGAAADVYTGYSTGTAFDRVSKVSDLFGANAEIPAPATCPL